MPKGKKGLVLQKSQEVCSKKREQKSQRPQAGKKFGAHEIQKQDQCGYMHRLIHSSILPLLSIQPLMWMPWGTWARMLALCCFVNQIKYFLALIQKLQCGSDGILFPTSHDSSREVNQQSDANRMPTSKPGERL